MMVLSLVAPHLGGAPSPDTSPLRVVVALIACLLIGVLAILFLRQRLGRNDWSSALQRLTPSRGAIAIGEVRRISLNGDVATVRHAGREYLLVIQAGATLVWRERDIGLDDAGTA